MKKVLFAGCCLLAAQASYCQNGELPPVNFPPGTNVCDNVPWKVVFEDEFNGNTLKPDWITFNSYAGMSKMINNTLIWGDHDDWGEGRCVYPYNAIDRDGNVEVGSGTCKLFVKKEPSSWQCATCGSPARNTQYSRGMIRLPFLKPNSTAQIPMFFNEGKFEARMRMPTFKYAHSCMWLWHGTNVNEIDIAESYGYSGKPKWPLFGYAPTCGYSVHAWEPGIINTAQNPYNMTHVEVAYHFPGQDWWDWLLGRWFKHEDWHTYTCEWDTAHVKFLVDGNRANEYWKYYREGKTKKGLWPFQRTYTYAIGSTCNPDPGVWRIMQGFPYNNNSMSALTLTTGIDKEDDSHPNGKVGYMEVDYVRAWQRHPEKCNQNTPNITGNGTICTDQVFEVSYPYNNGTWTTSEGLRVNSSTINRARIEVTSPSIKDGWIAYNYDIPGCDPLQVRQTVSVGPPAKPTIIESLGMNLFSPDKGWFELMAAPPAGSNTNIPLTYEWDVWYDSQPIGNGLPNPNNLRYHYHAFGQQISTPRFATTPGYSINMYCTVKASNICGITSATSWAKYSTGYKKGLADDTTNNHIVERDANSLAVVAAFTDDEAISFYEQQVDHRLTATFIDENENDETITATIQRVRMEELAPYIVIPEVITNEGNKKPVNSPGSETRIFPNPTSNNLTIVLSEHFGKEERVSLQVYNMTGVLVKTFENVAVQPNMELNVADLAPAVYSIVISQKQGTKEVYRFTKL